MQGTTASGAPYYKADGADYWLYWDPDCGGGSGGTARWILDNEAPSTTAASNLDGGGTCSLWAHHIYDDSSSPPQGLATPVTSDLRPKTEVSVYAFSEANAS